MDKSKIIVFWFLIALFLFTLGFWGFIKEVNAKVKENENKTMILETEKTKAEHTNNFLTNIKSSKSSNPQQTISPKNIDTKQKERPYTTQSSVNVSVTVTETASSDGVSNVPIKIEQEDKLSSIVPL